VNAFSDDSDELLLEREVQMGSSALLPPELFERLVAKVL
jgi:hypothetical protein